MNKLRKKQLLEELLIIVAEYFEPNISCSVINKYFEPSVSGSVIRKYFSPSVSCSVINDWLNDIEQEVLYRLKNEYPAHPIFTTSTEQISFWRDNNIDDHFWKGTEAIQQIGNIAKIFLSRDFQSVVVNKLRHLLMTLNLQNKFLDNVIYFKFY